MLSDTWNHNPLPEFTVKSKKESRYLRKLAKRRLAYAKQMYYLKSNELRSLLPHNGYHPRARINIEWLDNDNAHLEKYLETFRAVKVFRSTSDVDPNHKRHIQMSDVCQFVYARALDLFWLLIIAKTSPFLSKAEYLTELRDAGQSTRNVPITRHRLEVYNNWDVSLIHLINVMRVRAFNYWHSTGRLQDLPPVFHVPARRLLQNMWASWYGKTVILGLPTDQALPPNLLPKMELNSSPDGVQCFVSILGSYENKAALVVTAEQLATGIRKDRYMFNAPFSRDYPGKYATMSISSGKGVRSKPEGSKRGRGSRGGQKGRNSTGGKFSIFPDEEWDLIQEFPTGQDIPVAVKTYLKNDPIDRGNIGVNMATVMKAALGCFFTFGLGFEEQLLQELDDSSPDDQQFRNYLLQFPILTLPPFSQYNVAMDPESGHAMNDTSHTCHCPRCFRVSCSCGEARRDNLSRVGCGDNQAFGKNMLQLGFPTACTHTPVCLRSATYGAMLSCHVMSTIPEEARERADAIFPTADKSGPMSEQLGIAQELPVTECCLFDFAKTKEVARFVRSHVGIEWGSIAQLELKLGCSFYDDDTNMGSGSSASNSSSQESDSNNQESDDTMSLG